MKGLSLIFLCMLAFCVQAQIVLYVPGGYTNIGNQSPMRVYPSANAGVSGARKLQFVAGTSSTILEANSDYNWVDHDVIINAANASSGNTNQLVIYRNGNIGIGTPSPTARLHIMNGRGKIENDTESSIQYITANQSWDVGGNANGFYVYEGYTGTYKFVVNKNGNVGIGTTTPDKSLTVKGTIHANEVLVDMNAPIQGPDYVFEKDYDLLPLADLERYITDNKHLPEVPSAKEMEKDGLNLKEMNLLLLKKVEELTLHLIELKKENGAQSRMLSAQQEEINHLKHLMK